MVKLPCILKELNKQITNMVFARYENTFQPVHVLYVSQGGQACATDGHARLMTVDITYIEYIQFSESSNIIIYRTAESS